MIHYILPTVFILTTHTGVYAADDGSNRLCVWECENGENKTYPNICNSVNILCADHTMNPDNETEECPLYGTHTFSTPTACSSFQEAQSHSLYCLYKCNNTHFPNECLPKGQVCPSTNPNTGCPLYHDPVIFNGVSECEEFRENGWAASWAIEDCVSCRHLAEKISERYQEPIEDVCGVVYESIMFGASIGIGAVGTPAMAYGFDVIMIGIDGITASFSKQHDGLGDLICDAVGDASSEAIALAETEKICGEVMDDCSTCNFRSSSESESSTVGGGPCDVWRLCFIWYLIRLVYEISF